MFFHHLTLTIILFIQTALYISPAHADILRRLSCACANSTLQGYDIQYQSNRLHTFYNFYELVNDWDQDKYDEMCWKPPGHEFCYDRNFWGRDKVRLDSKEKKALPRKGRKDYPLADCTDQCRAWFGQESSCNQTSGHHHMAPNGTIIWKPFLRVTCSGKEWRFSDL